MMLQLEFSVAKVMKYWKGRKLRNPYMYMCKSPYIKIIVCVLEQLCYRPETSKLCHATESRFNAL